MNIDFNINIIFDNKNTKSMFTQKNINTIQQIYSNHIGKVGAIELEAKFGYYNDRGFMSDVPSMHFERLLNILRFKIGNEIIEESNVVHMGGDIRRVCTIPKNDDPETILWQKKTKIHDIDIFPYDIRISLNIEEDVIPLSSPITSSPASHSSSPSSSSSSSSPSSSSASHSSSPSSSPFPSPSSSPFPSSSSSASSSLFPSSSASSNSSTAISTGDLDNSQTGSFVSTVNRIRATRSTSSHSSSSLTSPRSSSSSTSHRLSTRIDTTNLKLRSIRERTRRSFIIPQYFCKIDMTEVNMQIPLRGHAGTLSQVMTSTLQHRISKPRYEIEVEYTNNTLDEIHKFDEMVQIVFKWLRGTYNLYTGIDKQQLNTDVSNILSRTLHTNSSYTSTSNSSNFTSMNNSSDFLDTTNTTNNTARGTTNSTTNSTLINKNVLVDIRNIKWDDMVWGGVVGNSSTTYDITYKVEGIRKLLIIHTTGLWLVFPPYEFNLILKPSDDMGIDFNLLSIFDSELSIPKKILTSHYIILNDCLCWKGDKNIQNKPRSQRLKCLEKIKDIINKCCGNIITLETKPTYDVGSVDSFFDIVKKYIDHHQEQNYVVEGLIFTPMNMPYSFSKKNYYNNFRNVYKCRSYSKYMEQRNLTTYPDVCKWIFSDNITIDFAIRWIENGNLRLYSYDDISNVLVPFTGTTCYPFDNHMINKYDPLILNQPTNLVVEFSWDRRGGQLKAQKLRFDKTHPNKLCTAIEYWKDIMDPIMSNDLTGDSLGLVHFYHQKIKHMLYKNIPKGSNILNIGSAYGTHDIKTAIDDVTYWNENFKISGCGSISSSSGSSSASSTSSSSGSSTSILSSSSSRSSAGSSSGSSTRSSAGSSSGSSVLPGENAVLSYGKISILKKQQSLQHTDSFKNKIKTPIQNENNMQGTVFTIEPLASYQKLISTYLSNNPNINIIPFEITNTRSIKNAIHQKLYKPSRSVTKPSYNKFNSKMNNGHHKFIDAVTIMHSMSSFWSTSSNLDALVQIIVQNLKPHGKILFFLLNGETIEQLLEPALSQDHTSDDNIYHLGNMDIKLYPRGAQYASSTISSPISTISTPTSTIQSSTMQSSTSTISTQTSTIPFLTVPPQTQDIISASSSIDSYDSSSGPLPGALSGRRVDIIYAKDNVYSTYISYIHDLAIRLKPYGYNLVEFHRADTEKFLPHHLKLYSSLFSFGYFE